MKKSRGYILALFIGLSLGWLGQQFWYISVEKYESVSSERELLRNEQRLKILRQKKANRLPVVDTTVVVSADNLIRDLVNSKHIDMASELFIDRGRFSRDDLNLVQGIVDDWLLEEHFDRAFSFLYEVRLFAEVDAEDILLNKIYAYVAQIEARLSERDDFDLLVTLFEQLINTHAEHAPYYLSLSKWQIMSGDTFQAELSLAGAMNDIRYQKEVEALQDLMTTSEQSLDQRLVPLTKVGEHYIVEVNIEGQAQVNLMLDTGASMTVVKTEIIESIWPDILDDAQVLSMNTANGGVSGYQVPFTFVTMGDLEIGSVDFGVIPLPDFQFDGLLGMNILSQFEFLIDQENSQLILNR